MLVLLLSPLTVLHCFHGSRSFMTNNSFVNYHQLKWYSMPCRLLFFHNRPCLCCNTETQQRRLDTTPATPNLYNKHPQLLISNSHQATQNTLTHTTTNRQTKTPNNPPTKKNQKWVIAVILSLLPLDALNAAAPALGVV